MLSHHESHVLALVRKWQPTTAYFLRKALGRSLASSFSDSPGSVYPVVERLKRRGLIAAEFTGDDKRRTEHLRCTAKGIQAIEHWIRNVGEETWLPEDPWRTRMLFADQLSRQDRLEWLAGLRALAEQQLLDLIDRSRLPVDDAFADALHHARLVTEARIVWIERLIARTVV